MAVDATAMVGGRSDSTPRQNGASARVPQRPAAAVHRAGRRDGDVFAA